uniref:EamA domain-containing protein n=1 Tax=viral metagenome TaxID=1070528 RepID=A0A6C0B9P6_9ZZZZ
MYYHIFGLTILKSINPYFRKHILTTLSSHDLLILNTFFIGIIVLCLFLYKCFFDKSILETFKNYRKLSFSQLGCLFIIAILAVISSLFIFELDKKYNSPLLNSLFLKIASVVALCFVSIFIFKEKYTWKQILGILLAILGIYLTINK